MPEEQSDWSERHRAHSPSVCASGSTPPNVALVSGASYEPDLDMQSGTEQLGPNIDPEGISASSSVHGPTIANHNTNLNSVSGSAMIANNNPAMNLGPGASVHYAPVNNFHTPAPAQDSSESIQAKIAAALKDRHVPNATYDAQPGKGCMDGTRVQILLQMERWILNPQAQQIFWLVGMAGMGKTTIAQTVCSLVHAETTVILGGSFFCSRSARSVAQRDVRCVVPTLAQLLARQSAEFSEALVAELKNDPDILHKQVAVQVKRLLYRPLLALGDSHMPILFVIDALDECGDEPTSDGTAGNSESHQIVSEMLEALVDFSRETLKLPVKFIVTSRPETHIRDTPVSDPTFSNVLHLHTVNKDQVTADIHLYVSSRLRSSPKLRTRFTYADAEMLADLSDGLFIFAATALKYVLDGGADTAASRFKKLLNDARNGLSSGAAAPLDRMYNFIIMDATSVEGAEAEDRQAILHLLASLLCARTALSVTVLADLLGMDKEDARARLSRLHAVIHVPDDDDEPGLRTLHASFGDYLLSRAPSDIDISDGLGHNTLARGCLRVMTERLCFNVSQTRSSYWPSRSDWPDAITASVQYACFQWIHHVTASPVPSELDAEINTVLRSRFLFWLEVVSFLKQVWRAAAVLAFAASKVRLPELLRFLQDAHAFVTSSHEAIERSPAHIYLSALPFAPKDSLIHQIFAPFCTGLISVKTSGIDRHGGRLIMTMPGRHSWVGTIAYSPDGCLVGSGSHGGTVRIWDTRTGEETVTPLPIWYDVVQLAFSPDSKSIAAATSIGVALWCLPTGQKSERWLHGHSGRVWSVTFSPNGTILASASEDKTVRLWEAENGIQIAKLSGHTDEVRAATFSPDGEILASGSDDGSIRLWRVALGKPVGRPLPAGGVVSSICFSPDGRKLASGGMGSGIQLWDLQTRTIRLTLHGHTDSIQCFQFLSDGQSLVSASLDGTVRLWTLPRATGEVLPIPLDVHAGISCCASFSFDGRYIASASNYSIIRIWDAGGKQQEAQPLPAVEGWIRSVVASPCGSFIVSGSRDRSVRLWDMQNGEPRLAPLLGHTETVHSVTISSDGRLIASASADYTVRLWDARTGEAVGNPLTGHRDVVFAVNLSPDTLWLASGSKDRTVRAWNTSTGMQSQFALLRCTGIVYTVVFSPEGRLLAAGDSAGRIYFWHPNTGHSVCEPLQVAEDAIRSIAFSPDGLFITAGGDDRKVRVWSINARQQLLSLSGHSDWVSSVAYSSNSELICSGSWDHTVRLWNASTGALIATLDGHVNWVNSVAFTSDGSSVISCSDDKTIRVWDVKAACFRSKGRVRGPVGALASATLKNGWLIGPMDELLAWVPEDYRRHLLQPPCTVVIGRPSVIVRVGGGVWYRGKNWTSCWRDPALKPIARTM